MTMLAKRSLEHAAAGYRNAQDVIKFMDTKVGVLTGLSALLSGFILQSLVLFFFFFFFPEKLPESTQSTVRELMEKHATETHAVVGICRFFH